MEAELDDTTRAAVVVVVGRPVRGVGAMNAAVARMGTYGPRAGHGFGHRPAFWELSYSWHNKHFVSGWSRLSLWLSQ